MSGSRVGVEGGHGYLQSFHSNPILPRKDLTQETSSLSSHPSFLLLFHLHTHTAVSSHYLTEHVSFVFFFFFCCHSSSSVFPLSLLAFTPLLSHTRPTSFLTCCLFLLSFLPLLLNTNLFSFIRFPFLSLCRPSQS